MATKISSVDFCFPGGSRVKDGGSIIVNRLSSPLESISMLVKVLAAFQREKKAGLEKVNVLYGSQEGLRSRSVTDKADCQSPTSSPKLLSHSKGRGNIVVGSNGNNNINVSSPKKDANGPQELAVPQAVTCPYHGPILQMDATPGIQGYGMNPMQRFMVHRPGEQYALFNRPDSGEISSSRNCTCATMMGFNFDMERGVHVENDELCGYQVGL
ncbi:hypothetical protein VTN00DRAFT_5464 [Thermoascus crustaceus]|uniref:uncharacterized protein n=1 Tax=Thermoascus crustaceus TaxID=5088 RepID=UPI0037446EE0